MEFNLKLRVFFALWLSAFVPQAFAGFHGAIPDDRTEISLRLQEVDRRPEFRDVRYRTYLTTVHRFGSSARADLASVEFESLTEQQFNMLKSIYGRNQSSVPYRGETAYNLTEFMPSILQTVVNSYFVPEVKDRNSESEFIAVNCWGLAVPFIYQFTRGTALPITVFYSPEKDFRSVVENPSFFNIVEGQVAPDSIQNPNARFGDLILSRMRGGNRGYIDHVRIFIDRDLYFEKVGPEPDQPFRLVTFPSSQVTGRYLYEYRRPVEGVPLPHPKDLFNTTALFHAGSGLNLETGPLAYVEVRLPLRTGPVLGVELSEIPSGAR